MIPPKPPIGGTVLRYTYLWHREALQGRIEGSKERPVALLLATVNDECIVVPITHTPPEDARLGVEIPQAEKRRLGLDDGRSWIVVSEVNTFVWPGPDLRPIPGREPGTVIYGTLSRSIFAEVLARAKALAAASRARMVKRQD